MWFEKRQYDEVHTVLKRGVLEDLRRVLSEVFSFERPEKEAPGICPKCSKPLTRQMLPYLEVLVNACPDYHGFWMTGEVSRAFRKSIGEELAVSSRRKTSRRMIAALLLFAGTGFILSLPPFSVGKKYQDLVERLRHHRVGQNYWPAASTQDLPEALPSGGESQTPQDDENAYYLQTWESWMREAITNRENMDAVLKSAHPARYVQSALGFYLQRQTVLQASSENTSVPESLKEFHEHWLSALKFQNLFYIQTVKARTEGTSPNLESRRTDPFWFQMVREARAAQEVFEKSGFPEGRKAQFFTSAWMRRWTAEDEPA